MGLIGFSRKLVLVEQIKWCSDQPFLTLPDTWASFIKVSTGKCCRNREGMCTHVEKSAQSYHPLTLEETSHKV